MASPNLALHNVLALLLPVLYAASGRENMICGAEQIAGTITYLMVQTPCLAMGYKVYIFLLKSAVNMATTAEDAVAPKTTRM